MLVKKGEAWKITHSRKGNLTVRFLNDGDTSKDDDWLHGEIIAGRARFMSNENRLAQREEGRGTPGDELTMRASFINLIERAPEFDAR